MIKLTKFSLKRPVTLILLLVTVLYFGIQSVLSSPMELTPDMNMPMQIIYTVYPGAAPEDISELITKPIEGNVSTLAGVDTVASTSAENISMVVIQYDYGTNMDTAYMNLRKSLDTIKSSLPEDAQEPTIYEIDINSTASMNIAVSGGTDENLYNYVNDVIVPELEKISSVGEVSVSGGQQSYIKIELIPEKLAQYNLNLNTIAQLITAADFSLPSGSVKYGNQDLNLTIGDEYRSVESIGNIVLPLQTGDVIHLSDVAVISNTLKDKTSLSRYNSEEVVAVAISKQQKASAVTLSRAVNRTLDSLQETNSTLRFKVVYDASEMIVSALSSVFKTLLIAVVLAMIVLFVFFGDWKASVIVGSSIPASVLVALTLMGAAGFSLNIVSVGSLALGVGMVVDNSIVVVESCFRAKEKMSFKEAAKIYIEKAKNLNLELIKANKPNYIIGYFDEEMLSVFAPITSNFEVKGYVVIHETMSSIEDSKESILSISYLLLILLFLLSLIILLFFTEFVYIPIKRITEATEHYAAGDMDYELVFYRSAEMSVREYCDCDND